MNRDEVRHSVKLYLSVVGAPTTQLCAHLLKLLDFPEYTKNEATEWMHLAYYIIESLAIHVKKHIDSLKGLPGYVTAANENIVGVMANVGKHPTLDSKRTVLIAIANALRLLAAHNGAKYPPITDSKGEKL